MAEIPARGEPGRSGQPAPGEARPIAVAKAPQGDRPGPGPAPAGSRPPGGRNGPHILPRHRARDWD
ncbi:hypothetical protein H696_01333 [Fonticula alba]|uniref:Uncharacterized protein n=1 Tax=Fonticula alba TaxID=691883 RepID=A0A058ZDB6_FONAL|nr:hypothetical protein H696_01333 [Fonticula alba]KCV71923.1 hypothetical protein H696_01333 [Fonticula alba]|eukprot:XP_009493501.1 hypothetical protein H696_01333 [Fonticula alba]